VSNFVGARAEWWPAIPVDGFGPMTPETAHFGMRLGAIDQSTTPSAN